MMIASVWPRVFGGKSFSATGSLRQSVTATAAGVLLVCSVIGQAQAASSDHFVTTWKTDNQGSSDTEIFVPMIGGPYDVDWDGDGIFDEFGLTGTAEHDYGVAGTYQIRIDGTYTSIRFFIFGDQQKLISVDQWGTQKWTSMEDAFIGCTNLQIVATDTPDFSAVTSMARMFTNATLVNPDTSGWDTSAVTSMYGMFLGATSANPDTSGWDTSSVTDMKEMFQGATSANPDTSGWNTSAVGDMSGMFAFANSANPDTSGWDTSAVTSMNFMFMSATAANPDTHGWNTSAVTGMNSMFAQAAAADPDTSSWDTAAVTDMAYMFQGATAANPDTSSWDTSAVTSMQNLFQAAMSANPDTSGWDTSSVTTMSSMFWGAALANPDTSGWDTTAVTDMSFMFNYAESAKPETSSWNVTSLTNATSMFDGVTLSTANYESLLINWSAQALQPGVTFSGGNSTYCSDTAANARANMINSDGWTITDGGQVCEDTIFVDGFETE